MAQEQKAGARPFYRDIAERTQGDMYIGVVGPVRTGKSTLIKGFMEQLVLPLMAAGPRRDRVTDELPQSGSGRTIMTTQPKFIPGEGAAEVQIDRGLNARVRMIDSVGYLIPGALGTQEGEAARMVSTPWADHDLPFEEAAALGTRKVIEDHATIGVVVTTDGTVADLPRSNYVPAEEQVIRQLKALRKPFAVVLNSARPDSGEAQALRVSLENKYDVPVTLLNVKEMQQGDLQALLSSLLLEFPLREIRFAVPGWLGALEDRHWLPAHAIETIRTLGETMQKMRDKEGVTAAFAGSPYLMAPRDEQVNLGEGALRYELPVKEGLFNQVLSEQCGETITGDAHLLSLMKELVAAKREYDRVAGALRAVQQTGYGLVTPAMSEVKLQEPELMRQGNRYGVRLRASAPTLHLIRSDIETEIAPVLGAQEQSEEFVKTLREEYEKDPQSLWDTNFFGKSLKDLIQEGVSGKLNRMPTETQEKVQAALTKMLNEGDGGMICILL
ncbi:MAG: stage IV sporulation protein A [Clostridiales bacterium]|nr:stage IV sporulation protein A [Clostridiales bacterium]